LQSQLDLSDNRIMQAEKTMQEQNNSYQVALQEVRNHQRAIEQLKSDLALSRSSSSDENSRLNQDLCLLRDDLELTKTDLEESRIAYSSLRAQHDDLKEEHESEKRRHTDAVTEINRRGDEIHRYEKEVCELRKDLAVCEGRIEELEEKQLHLEDSLASYKQKYEEAARIGEQLESTLSTLQEELADTRNAVSPKL
jgi:chromosome segregation ATPase